MNWVDWIIGILFVFFIFRGFQKGFIKQLFDLLGSVAAIILGFYFGGSVGDYLATTFKLSSSLGGIIGFALIIALVVGLVSFLSARLQKKQQDEPLAIIDKSAGALFAGVKVTIGIIIVLLLLLATPWKMIHDQVRDSDFAADLLRFAPVFSVVQDVIIPANLPRLIVTPDGVGLRAVDEEDLKKATCLHCGSKVEYRGHIKQGLVSYHQVVCPKCHRVSDGCLTFEGFHTLYGVCPYERLGSDGLTDCKVWPNPEPTLVKGRCSVCGRNH